MAFEQRNNSGSMFRNDRKEKDTHPDYKGSALIDGVEYWMDAWIKTSKDGRKFMSFAFKPKAEAQSTPPQRAAQGKAKPQGQQRPPVDGPVDDDMEIPF